MSYIYTTEQNYYHFVDIFMLAKKKKKCQICIFVNDLIIFEDLLYEITNSKHIPKLYSIIKRFFYIMKYWAKINLELTEHFNCFVLPFYQCLPIVLKT